MNCTAAENRKRKRNAVNYDEIPEMLYGTIIDLTQRGWVDTAEGKDIEAENERMKAYLAENLQVKIAAFSNKNGAIIATSEIALLHRVKVCADQLTEQGLSEKTDRLSGYTNQGRLITARQYTYKA